MIIANKEELGRLIKQTRLIKGLSGVQLASKAGTFQSVISSIESGSNSIKLDTMLRVARALGMKLDISFTEGDSK